MLLGNSVIFGSRGYRLFLDDDQDSGGAKADSESKPDTEDENDPDLNVEGLGDKGKETIRKIRGERDAEKQKAADLDKQVRDLTKKVNDLTKKKQDEADEEAKQQGKFEQLAEKRKTELEAANSTIESLEERVEQMSTVLDRVLEDQWKELPKEVQDAYPGDDTDGVKKLEWLPKARKLAEAIKGSGSGERRQGHGADPNPSATDRQKLEDEVAAGRARVGFNAW
jgi:alanyl-tRNA synthetase